MHNQIRTLQDIVTRKDPDMLLSWDTQGAGLGYIIERSLVLGKDTGSTGQDAPSSDKPAFDMVQLLGRTKASISPSLFFTKPSKIEEGKSPRPSTEGRDERKWKGSGLGSDWDDRVGAGAASASIVSPVHCSTTSCSTVVLHTFPTRLGDLFLLGGKLSPRK